MSVAIYPLSTEPAAHPRRQHVLRVVFESADGARWEAIGGGDTMEDAIAFARESTPERFRRVMRITDVYGD
jgi:hypothetical protein